MSNPGKKHYCYRGYQHKCGPGLCGERPCKVDLTGLMTKQEIANLTVHKATCGNNKHEYYTFYPEWLDRGICWKCRCCKIDHTGPCGPGMCCGGSLVNCTLCNGVYDCGDHSNNKTFPLLCPVCHMARIGITIDQLERDKNKNAEEIESLNVLLKEVRAKNEKQSDWTCQI